MSGFPMGLGQLRHAATVACATAALLSAACSGGIDPGKGTLPTELYLSYGGRTQAFSVYECLGGGVTAMLVFDGDSHTEGDFSSRVQWVSSDPETLYVADGVSADRTGTIRTAGSIIAQRPGHATLTASYLEFTASASVEVLPVSGLRISPALTDIAADLEQQFGLYLKLDNSQTELDATDSALWQFTYPTATASVESATGLVKANSANELAITLSASLAGCGLEAQQSFRVSDVQALELGYEQGSETRLPVGFSEAVTVSARFADPDSTLQNVATAVEIDNLDDDALSVSRGEQALYAQALDEDAGAGQFTVQLPRTALLVQSKTWTVTDAALLRFSLSPTDLRVQYPATGQLQALGEFDDGVSRAITRHVSFTSTDGNVVVSSQADDAGEVTVADADLTVEITASQPLATEDSTDSVTVRSYAAASRLP